MAFLWEIEIHFLTMIFLGNKTSFDDQCPQEKDYEDAKDVAKFFDIELHRVDFVKEYWDDVFSYLIEEYKKGRTPNPDIFCNKYIKFAKFADFAFNKLNADYIATGHYAKTKDGKLYKAFDLDKDQSYFLAQLSNKQLEKVIFPLDSITKKEVRLIANKLGLSIANKKRFHRDLFYWWKKIYWVSWELHSFKAWKYNRHCN